MSNEAFWINGIGKETRVGPAELKNPAYGQVLIKAIAVPVLPGEWKIHAGLIPIPLNLPTVIGLVVAGFVEKVGFGVTRFKAGDRVAANSTGVATNDPRFGSLQKYVIAPETLTMKIGDTPFEEAATLVSGWAAYSALFRALPLEPPINGQITKKNEKVLIWGASSVLGSVAVQVAEAAGYNVVGVASGRNASLVKSLGNVQFVDRTSATAADDVLALGPYKAVFAAQDDAEDQVKIGKVLAAQGGGTFNSTAGNRSGVTLPEGVTATFHQYLFDFLKPEEREFTKWVWWGHFEEAIISRRLTPIPWEVRGDLTAVAGAWESLRNGSVSGKRLIIKPNQE
ncbi:hypothetical protein H0G86_008805 [Trichoderma simmonsii]|uniref:Enoyl reductase (ER) domain-containing protein n=1 Tax=Trichoderma simmonsii TaxID=1491479 RepID=A0A8G0LLH4_9HYPO|nr:hypothetical protein H0G86_008805 [Trichoderma simmonsii]